MRHSRILTIIYLLKKRNRATGYSPAGEGGPPATPLAPKGDDLFDYDGMLLKFHRDSGGIVRGFSVESDELKGLSFVGES